MTEKETESNEKTGKYEEKKENLFENGLNWCKKKIARGVKIVQDNKKELLILVPSILGAAKFVNHVYEKAEDKREEQERERRVYDPNLGDWWYLKRPLSNNERLDLESRVKYGESRGQVLKDMGVLRRR